MVAAPRALEGVKRGVGLGVFVLRGLWERGGRVSRVLLGALWVGGGVIGGGWMDWGASVVFIGGVNKRLTIVISQSDLI